jgi:hypothetical protein
MLARAVTPAAFESDESSLVAGKVVFSLTTIVLMDLRL